MSKSIEVIIPEITVLVEDVDSENEALEFALDYLANIFAREDAVEILWDNFNQDVRFAIVQKEDFE